ncbi:hypothetical protein AB0A74_38965 [Saccharothrix sp. NPDC042600]|uniref:hypothetical protein n=1 Tax=Saccharothrix TaxID=2071 RepID=UPI0033FE3F70
MVAEFPEDMANGMAGTIGFSADAERAYFVVRDAIDQDPYLKVVHTGTFDELSRIVLPGYGVPLPTIMHMTTPVVVGPNDERAYVGVDTCACGSVVLELDLREEVIRQEFTYPDAGRVVSIALMPDGTAVHVGHWDETLAIDLRSGEVLRYGELPRCVQRRLAAGGELYRLPISENDRGCPGGRPATHDIHHRIPIRAGGGLGSPLMMAFNRGGEYVYVPHRPRPSQGRRPARQSPSCPLHRRCPEHRQQAVAVRQSDPFADRSEAHAARRDRSLR